MQTEITISAAAARATLALIHEYLAKGGAGLDPDALEEMQAALGEADRIVIAQDADATPANALRVIWRRNACGAVASVEIWRGDAEKLHDTAATDDPEEALDHMLNLASDYYDADPYGGHLPPNHAVIAAWAGYWGADA